MAFQRARGKLGIRGRGGGRNSSRSRGRGGSQGRPVFDSMRISQRREKVEDLQEKLEAERLSQNSETSVSDDDLYVDEDEEKASSENRPYAVLMELFTNEYASQRKRRKLEHDYTPGNERTESDTDLSPNGDIDHVEETEDRPETMDDDILGDDDSHQDPTDPFETQFAEPNMEEFARRMQVLRQNQSSIQKVSIPNVGRTTVSVPIKNLHSISLPSPSYGPADLRLKQKLKVIAVKRQSAFDPLESPLWPIIFGYQDVLYCARNVANAEKLRRMTCLHAINHVFKTRDRVVKNNAHLAREEPNDSSEYRDQGFTRPKVLYILPTRGTCTKMIDTIISLCEPEQQENRKRFDDTYVESTEKVFEDKALDFRELFGGNDDDMFRLGIKFTRKTVKYFSQFYNSDMILASPLGLRMALEGSNDKKGDCDFLSSIEIVIVDQADALLMQNWEHVEFIFDQLNLQPKEAHGCDFSRVRSWYLDSHAKYFRQTIALTAFNTPELNTLFYNRSVSWRGKVKIDLKYQGAIQELDLKVKQSFSRFESPSFASDPDARFNYFTAAIVPALTRRSRDSAGTLVFIPSYLDFVRIRNFFATSSTTSDLSFGNISEYTSVRDVARARTHFFSGRHDILLYTERAHHFRRYQIRGVRKIIMYGLPDNPIFYREIVGGFIGRSLREGRLAPAEGIVRIVFSKWDVLKLERVAGTERVGKMLKDKGDTFDFV